MNIQHIGTHAQTISSLLLSSGVGRGRGKGSGGVQCRCPSELGIEDRGDREIRGESKGRREILTWMPR